MCSVRRKETFRAEGRSNVDCALRVLARILTDWLPEAIPLLGIIGTLEVIAVSWWGVGLSAIVARGRRAVETASPEFTAPCREPVLTLFSSTRIASLTKDLAC
jgi:hypothetical protein